MALSRPQWIALGLAGMFAVAMPGLSLLWAAGGEASAATSASPARPVAPPRRAPIVSAYERTIFAPAETGDDAPTDAPALVGIAGRLNRDAVAMVRLADGKSRSLKLGESVDGWRLESLAIDAAFFTRGRERVRVVMAADDAPSTTPSDQ